MVTADKLLAAIEAADDSIPTTESTSCADCGKERGRGATRDYCRNCYGKRRAAARKAALIEQLGGCCMECGQTFDPVAYDFHHVHEKRFRMSYHSLVNRPAADLAEEASKCLLLCAICHRLLHAGG